MSPTGDLIVASVFLRGGFSRACSESVALAWHDAGGGTLRGNSREAEWGELGRGAKKMARPEGEWSPTLENFLRRLNSPAHFVRVLSGKASELRLRQCIYDVCKLCILHAEGCF